MDMCFIMHILLICKLASKPLEIENQLKKATKVPKTQKNYTKIEKISQKYMRKDI